MARPKAMTEEVIAELERRFRVGSNVLEAIDGLIAESTYYLYLKEDTEFSERMEAAQEFTTEIARAVVAKRVHKGDVDTAKWWLERRNKQKFSPRQELTGEDGKDLGAVISAEQAEQLIRARAERSNT